MKKYFLRTTSLFVKISNIIYNNVIVLTTVDMNLTKVEYLKNMYRAIHSECSQELYLIPLKDIVYLKWCECRPMKSGDTWMGPYQTSRLYSKCCDDKRRGIYGLEYEGLKIVLNVILNEDYNAEKYSRILGNGPKELEVVFDKIKNKKDIVFRPGFGNLTNERLCQPSYSIDEIYIPSGDIQQMELLLLEKCRDIKNLQKRQEEILGELEDLKEKYQELKIDYQSE